MPTLTRRALLHAGNAAMLGGLAAPALGIDPIQRVHSRITGLGLTTYSLKPHMKWFWGKQTQGEWEMHDFLNYCAELGLDGAEITSYFFELPVKTTYLKLLRRQAHRLGLDITGGAMGNDFAHHPTSDAGKRQLAYCRKWIDHFAELGAPVMRIFASKSADKDANPDAVLRNVQANVEIALAHAEKRGVMLGMENHDYVKNIDYLLRVVEAIDSRWFGVIWDSANLASTPDPYAELARIAPYAIVAQVKVMTQVNGEDQPADFARLVKILRDANFAGPLIFEYEEPEDPIQAIPIHLKQLRAAIAT